MSTIPPGKSDAPRITLLPRETRIDLIPPLDCCASVVIKWVARDHNVTPQVSYYVWWAVAGRYEDQAFSTTLFFERTEQAIRFDVPAGVLLSTDYLQRHLSEADLEGNGTFPEDTPIIRG